MFPSGGAHGSETTCSEGQPRGECELARHGDPPTGSGTAAHLELPFWHRLWLKVKPYNAGRRGARSWRWNRRLGWRLRVSSVKGRALFRRVGLCACRCPCRLLLPRAGVPAALGCPSTVPVCLSPRSAAQPSGARGRALARCTCCRARNPRCFAPELAQAAWTSAASVLSGHFEGTARPLH